MSDGNGDWPEEPAERVRELVEGVLDELDLEGEVEISEDDDRIDAVGRRRRRLRAADRQARPDDRRAAAALLPGGLPRACASASGSSSTPPATASAAARCSSPAPTAPPSRPSSGNRTVEMDPMSAQERRVVHEHLKERAGVETYSEGDEPHRCVVVAPLVSE